MSAHSSPWQEPGFEPDTAMAERLFAELLQRTGTDRGVTRTSYGLGEQIAHSITRREAEALGLSIDTDDACNLYMTLKGANAGLRIMIGSHLDSVPRGGNYDGAAGVIMGLCVLSGFVKAGIQPPHDITVMAIRAEESAWFGGSYLGSRAAFGQLTPDDLSTVRRADDDIALGEAIDAAGGSAEALRQGAAFLDPARLAMFIEPHIEQGPVLVANDVPVGIVTDIRGSFRYRRARCHGVYAHSGATPRDGRQDAVRAVSTLVVEFDALWQRLIAAGEDVTLTVGQFATDPDEAAFSKVAGRVDFSVDVRSASESTLDTMSGEIDRLVSTIAHTQNVRFDFGKRTRTQPAAMHPDLVGAIERAAGDVGIQSQRMPCGAGHDAVTFATMDVATGMLFLRNENGSHNPDERLDMADFAAGASVLARLCLDPPDIAT